ncbi:MAG: CDP-alcohol phosphatidyltransferase family protein [Bacteroidota bacterium]
MVRKLPHIITLLNLYCGCCALVFIFQLQFTYAFLFILFGALADWGDGLVARALNIKSDLGKELDSLADMVTFGMVPGAILYMLLMQGFEIDRATFKGLSIGALPAFIVTLFAAYRLAKFNLDTRQTDSFIGLPTPSCTMFVVGLMLIYEFDTFGLRDWVTKPFVLYPIILTLSYLLIAELPMFSLKFKSMKWQGNETRFTFLLLAMVLLIVVREATFSIIVVLYVLFSLFDHLRGRRMLNS